MDVSSRGLPPLAMDLSKGYSVRRLTQNHSQAVDMTKKSEWYHRQPPNCSTDMSSPYTRTSSMHPDPSSVRRRDLDQPTGNYMNSGLPPALDLYHDRNLWHPGFYKASGDAGPESSPGEEEDDEDDSDSDSDVIFLVSSTKEPLLCTPFIQDSVTHIVQPLSPPLDEGRSCYHLPQPVTSPSHDSSYSDDSSESSVDIPIHHARPIVLLSDLSAVYQSTAEASSDDSDVIEISLTNNKRKLCKKSPPQSEKESVRKLRRSRSKTSCDTPPLTPRRSLRRQVKKNTVGIYNESYDSDDVFNFVMRVSSSDDSVSQPIASQRMSRKEEKTDNDDTLQKASPSRSPPREEERQCKSVYTKCVSKKRKKLPAKILAKQNCKEVKEQHVLVKKSIKRRKKKTRLKHNGPPSLFPDIEPELALKYARKKKDRKLDAFSPFVHIDQQKCTVVNYHEEEESAQSKIVISQNVTGFVPSTSCFHLGRLSSESKTEKYLRCCLCGRTANTMTLGDLHGPYYPATLDTTDLRTKVQNGYTENHAEEEGEGFQNKSSHADGDLLPPDVPLNLEECWIHEDCGVWSAGVFLVRGKVYGLKEAAILAQQTICSSCQQPGAIMGCFQKGCSRSFHYACAIQSGCVLNEDNFSMRCPDHKNKACVSRQHNR